MKKILSMALAFAVTLTLAACGGNPSSSSASTNSSSAPGASTQSEAIGGESLTGALDIAIGNSGSTQEIIGANVIELLKETLPGVNISSVNTSGITANAGLLVEDGCHMATITADTAYSAFAGEAPFETPCEDLRAICTLVPNSYQVWANKSANIKDFSDIIDKKVCFGTPGSAPYQPSLNMMSLFGFSEEDMKAAGGELVTVAWADAVDMLADGNIDVLIWSTSFPASAIVNAQAGGKEFDFVQIAPDMIDKYIETYPGWTTITVPAGTYAGQTEDVTYQSYYVKASMSEELAYRITETICTNYPSLRNVHALMADIGDDTIATGTGLELHPGAQRYYDEHNIPHSK